MTGAAELPVAAEPGDVIYHDVHLPAEAERIDVRLAPGGTINFVGYEA